MAKSKKVPDGMRAVYAIVPDATWERFAAVMADTRRGLGEELAHAMERHAENPPKVVAEALPPSVAVEGSGRKRGRPKGSTKKGASS